MSEPYVLIFVAGLGLGCVLGVLCSALALRPVIRMLFECQMGAMERGMVRLRSVADALHELNVPPGEVEPVAAEETRTEVPSS